MCLTHHLWEDLSAQIHKFLSNISLADLVSKREVEKIARNQHERMCTEQEVEDHPQGGLERIAASSL